MKMPSQIRAFLFLCVLLVGYQCFAFWQALGHPLSLPARVAMGACFAMQEGVILWLAWLAGVRRKTLARWFLAGWLALRLALPVLIAVFVTTWSLADILKAAFWRDPEIPSFCLWAGAVYFVFSRGARPWFAKVPVSATGPSAAPDAENDVG